MAIIEIESQSAKKGGEANKLIFQIRSTSRELGRWRGGPEESRRGRAGNFSLGYLLRSVQ